MPRAMYICPVCHKNVLASKAIHIKTRYYHKACLDKKIKKEKEKIDNDKLTKKQREQYERALKQSALPEIPEAVPESEAQAAEKFFTKVEQIQGKCTAKSSAMAYKYKDMYEFTWEGMEQTLEYCFSILGLTLREDGEIVGLIPWYYDQAQSFYKQLNNIESQKVDLDKLYKKKYIKVTPKKKDVDLIDISKIGE
mgnify:CR=1 FL=1